jgi:hypothetical protein
MKQLLLPALALALLTQCHKSAPDPAKPEDQLPPATQTGANTFGCLINGKLYIPKGTPSRPGLIVQYDPILNGGYIAIAAEYTSTNTSEGIFIKGYPVKTVASYSLNLANPRFDTGYYNDSSPSQCQNIYGASSIIYRTGTLVITRLDQQAGIISGTFDAKLLKSGCDTIRITQGRFDYKL